MTKVEFKRDFAHRTYGAIGSVELAAMVGDIKLDGQVLPDTSVEYLLNFALQSLQDAYAGAKDAKEAQALWAKKRDALIAGTIGVRTGGAGVDEATAVARIIVRQYAKAKLGAKSKEWAKFTGLSDADQNAKLDEWHKANEAAFADAIKAELKRREEKRATKITGIEIAL